MYMLVRKGVIQLFGTEIDGQAHTGVLLAENHKDAILMASMLSRETGRKVAPCEIGTIEGETLDKVLASHLETGEADCALVFTGPDRGGMTFQIFKPAKNED